MQTTTMAMLAAALAACSAPGATQEGAVPQKPIMEWGDLLNRPQPKPDTTLRYGDDPLQIVDVWVPQGAGPHPAVIMIHGGCWQTAVAQRDIMNWIADDLRRYGVGVWNIEYRGVDRGGGYPGTFDDVGAAADLFAREGGKHGFAMDAPRIAIGHSAGGHLALWLARRPALAADDALRGSDPVKIDLAISQGGLPDLRAGAASVGHACGAEAPRDMARGEYARTSPPEMPPGDAVEVQFNNALDRVTPPATGEAYIAAMAQRGRAVTMEVTPGEGHVELIAPDSVSWAKQRAAILKTFGMEAQR
ncbi:alpha/beta hydrolase family protein [Sphingopyxis sp. PET50]|uniref:alpha/beta hydrolase family protein n=1 Tax=Sphingopyxis sp. PET50 TaxID=2976533 RepID=UPI0021AF4E8D|nr:alpha/beta hydrolase [Sphingopyxis sp. PET50]